MYIILNLLSLFIGALSIAYGVAAGYMFATRDGDALGVVQVALLFFIVALIFRAIADIGMRLIAVEELLKGKRDQRE